MGEPSYYSGEVAFQIPGRCSLRPPSNSPNEVHCKELLLVAVPGQGPGAMCTELSGLSGSQECSSCSSIASMVVASQTLPTFTPRFCGAFPGQDIFDCGGLPL